ncbi:ABC transporter permease [Vibrio genomosp. F10]|uniref:ABC transporter permease n=1 Tax=Vibrio genomosp. F10 TaxID=723171 RepID=UPI0002DAC61E|nr:FtsX-like permease family protein [Vibrio genomosp. F10]OEF06736.1 ABC transporter permease [Vibrio genomosp. F10 str. 9ZD137]
MIKMSTDDRGISKATWLVNWSLKEIRHGQLWPIALSLSLIIACVFALSALAERIEQVVVKQGKDALTSDLVFQSSNPLPQSLEDAILKAPIEVSRVTRFATMAFSATQMQLVTVKALESNYPLRGTMRLASDVQESQQVKKNELWLDKRLLTQLDVVIGDSLAIGDADFIVSGTIEEEPGLSFNPFQQMPTVLIHYSDIAKTGAIQIGSRVRYQLYINGNEPELEQLKNQVTLTASERWKDTNTASRTNDIFINTTQYLSLSVAIVILMAAATLVLTCQSYVASRRTTIAMLKSLGATKRWLTRWILLQIGILLLVSIALGFSAGMLLEYLLRLPLVDILPEQLPSYGLSPYLLSVATCVLIAVPALGIPLLNLFNISASQAMQPASKHIFKRRYYWLIAIPVLPLLSYYASNALVWMLFGGLVGIIVTLAIISLAITKLMTKLPLGATFKLALNRIHRTPVMTGLQYSALGLSLMLMATLWLVRTDLLQDWQKTLPANAANAFSLNISEQDRESYLEQLDQNKVERSQAFPIIRGRLTHINGVDAKEIEGAEEKSDALRRELNFTWGDTIPEYNPVLEGEWSEVGGVSVESEVAQDLGINIGDTLTFTISAQTIEAKVNSIRKVEWREMKPNFYFIFTSDLMADHMASYLISFRIDPEHDSLMQRLSREYPTVSFMDIREVGSKIEQLLRQFVWAITLLAGLGGLAGLLLIFTLLQLSLSQRQQELRLYRTLGATQKFIKRTIWAEYGLMALVAGIVASLGAELLVASILKFGFDLSATWHFMLWIALPLVAFCTLFVVVRSLVKTLLTPMSKEIN